MSVEAEQERQEAEVGEDGVPAEVSFLSAREVSPPKIKPDLKNGEEKATVHPMFKNNKPKRPTRDSPKVKVTDGVIELLDSDEENLDDSSASPSPARDDEE